MKLDPIIVQERCDLLVLFRSEAIERFRRVDHARDRMRGPALRGRKGEVAPSGCDAIVDTGQSPQMRPAELATGRHR